MSFKSVKTNMMISAKEKRIALKVQELQEKVYVIKKNKKPKRKQPRRKKTKKVQKMSQESHVVKSVEAKSKNILTPIYPERARILNLEGKATAKIVIDDKGNVQDVKIIKSSGHKILDLEMIETIKKGSFSAALLNGKPVVSEKILTFSYELQ